MSDISIRTIASLEEVNSEVWDALDHGSSPFQRYGFLRALEESASVGPDTGWLPSYMLVESEGRLLGACAAYIKTDSYGEYIFDWAWARAAGHFGQAYYPKLVVAAPFTPASGKRLLIAPGEDLNQVTAALMAGIVEMVKRFDLSSAHILFCSDEEASAMEEQGLARRASYQFHWFNRDYVDFEAFLSALKSRKRKQIRKERSRAQDAIDSIEFVPAREMRAEDFSALDRFYRKTVAEHHGFDYLRPGFFEAAAKRLPDTMYFARVCKDDRVVAGAVFFETDTALYGRYWGADEELDFLHFEVAYYAAIERCIERGLKLFEAGAQGQHKLLRGFEPTMTHSCHLMADRKFDAAIRGFVEQERREVEGQMRHLASCGPYRCEGGGGGGE
jgi:predicted N-acyltransferase